MPENLQNALKWFDLSFGYGNMPKAVAQEIIDTHIPGRCLFASDMPWHRPSWKKRLIETLDISEMTKKNHIIKML